jgi:putative transposase
VFVTLRGEPYLLMPAVDQHGVELDILLQKRRDKAAATRFFRRVLASCHEVPRKVRTKTLSLSTTSCLGTTANDTDI